MACKSPKNSPVKIIQITEDSYLSLDQDYLKSDISNSTNPVVAIIGKARSGRSSLINKLFGTTFSTSKGFQPHTKNAWIQNSQNGSQQKMIPKVSIIDIQGFGTTSDAKAYNKLLLSIMMISDVVIFNSPDGSINEQQIRSFGSIIRILRQLFQERVKKCQLVWIVRNFILQLVDHQGNQITMNQYLQRALQTKESSKSNYRFRKSIKQYFQVRHCLFLPPDESPNYLQTFQKLSLAIYKILYKRQTHKQRANQCASINQNHNLRKFFLKNLIGELNTSTISLENTFININQVYKVTLIDYLSNEIRFKQQHFIDKVKSSIGGSKEEYENWSSKCESVEERIVKKPHARNIWKLYFGTQVNQKIVEEVEKYLQIAKRNRQISKAFDLKVQSSIFQFESLELNQNQLIEARKELKRPQQHVQKELNDVNQKTDANYLRELSTDDLIGVQDLSIMSKMGQVSSQQVKQCLGKTQNLKFNSSKINKKSSICSLKNFNKINCKKLRLENLPKLSKVSCSPNFQLMAGNQQNILMPTSQTSNQIQGRSLLKNNKSFNHIPLKETLLLQTLKKSKQNQQRLEKHVQTLHRILQEQQQSYKRRLNLSKQYMKRIQNQNQIVRKELYYCKSKIQNYQREYQYFQNVEIFQCWKCLEKIVADKENTSIISHMRICQGPVSQQLEITVLSETFISNKSKAVVNLQQKRIYTILIKVIPTRNRKWEIKRQYSQIKRLQRGLVERYAIQGISQKEGNKKTKNTNKKSDKSIPKQQKVRQSYSQKIQMFFNRCVSQRLICCDNEFKDFLAGN